MIRRILVPLDGSAIAERALSHAIAVARAFGAELLLVRVVEAARVGGLAHDAVDSRLHRAEAVSYLETRAERVRAADVVAETEILEGRAAEEIVDLAVGRDVDLIVLSPHGKNGATEFALGGTAQKVVSGAGVSILLVRDGEGAESTGEGVRYGRVMVPCDCSPRGEWALCLAASIARAQGAELYIVHAVPEPPVPSRLPVVGPERELRHELLRANKKAARRYLREAESKFAAPDLAVRTRLLVSPQVARALQETAAEEGVGLLVVSAHGASGPSPWPYGSVADNLLHYSRVPILVLQDLPRRALAPQRKEKAPSVALAHNGAGP